MFWAEKSEKIVHLINKLFSGLMSRVFANGPVDQGSIPGRVIPKTKNNATWYHLA